MEEPKEWTKECKEEAWGGRRQGGGTGFSGQKLTRNEK
jgi:hypothetical protein